MWGRATFIAKIVATAAGLSHINLYNAPAVHDAVEDSGISEST
jgi:hypothetical protein